MKRSGFVVRSLADYNTRLVTIKIGSLSVLCMTVFRKFKVCASYEV